MDDHYTMSRYPPLLGTSEYVTEGEAIRARVLESLPQDLRLGKEYAERKSVIDVPETCGLLTEEELAITALDTTGVRDAVRDGKLSAVQVVKAFGRRAAIAHQLVFCKPAHDLDSLQA
jgi:amidase